MTLAVVEEVDGCQKDNLEGAVLNRDAHLIKIYVEIYAKYPMKCRFVTCFLSCCFVKFTSINGLVNLILRL